MDTRNPPYFEPSAFNRAIDRTGDWIAAHVPWKRIELSRLYQRREFVPGDGWGRNAWGELYRGDSYLRLYAAVPEHLLNEYNLVLIYRDSTMRILRGARPDFTKPRSSKSPELACYFRWTGEPM